MSPLALGPLVAVGIAVPVAWSAAPHTSAMRKVDLAHLTWFNVWRVPAAIAFFVVGAQGLLPAPFVTNTAWGDLIAGGARTGRRWSQRVTWRRRRTGAYLAFHLFSFGDFLVAVGTGLTFTVLGDPLMPDPARHPDGADPALGGADHGGRQLARPAPAAHRGRAS